VFPRGLPLQHLYIAKAFQGRAGSQVLNFVYLADFDLGRRFLAHRIRETLASLERLLPRFHLDEGVAGDEFLGLGEWPIDHGALLPRVPDAPAL
jgi:hypothetical protein